MIVRDIMKTDLVTVEPDDSLGHAASLLRQYEFHHLPVARNVKQEGIQGAKPAESRNVWLYEGLLTSNDIELAAALAQREDASEPTFRPWQEQRVAEVMRHASLCITPETSAGAAAQMLVERGISCLPVVEYGQGEQETRMLLVGLLTRSDFLIAMARALGTFEPGVQLDIAAPAGDLLPLAETIRIANELHMPVRSIVAAPMSNGVPDVVTLRLGTINLSPLLLRLHTANIQYSCIDALVEGETHD